MDTCVSLENHYLKTLSGLLAQKIEEMKWLERTFEEDERTPVNCDYRDSMLHPVISVQAFFYFFRVSK
jgi:hypothetical protein